MSLDGGQNPSFSAGNGGGGGPMRFLWRVLVPLSWNTIGALAVIQFVYMWNQYLWPLIIINENER